MNAPKIVPPVQGFPPLAEAGARVLILGSMPGTASLSADAYYAHPRNLFWPFMGSILGFDPAATYAARCAALGASGIALWDVLKECVRAGSLDSAILPTSVVPNDINGLLARCPHIRTILFNGSAADQMFRRHVLPGLAGSSAYRLVRLPSTSPAHASQSGAAKLAVWSAEIARALDETGTPG